MKRQFALVTVRLLLAYTGVTWAERLVLLNFVTWSQKPDMDQGIDYLFMHRTNGPIVVDDPQSDGREISAFHWSDSYLKDPNSGQDWDAGQGPERIVSFEISIHQDCPVGDAACGNGRLYNYSTSRDVNYFSAIDQK